VSLTWGDIFDCVCQLLAAKVNSWGSLPDREIPRQTAIYLRSIAKDCDPRPLNDMNKFLELLSETGVHWWGWPDPKLPTDMIAVQLGRDVVVFEFDPLTWKLTGAFVDGA